MEKTFEGDGSLDVDGGEVITIYGGTDRQNDPDEIPLSEIIARSAPTSPRPTDPLPGPIPQRQPAS